MMGKPKSRLPLTQPSLRGVLLTAPRRTGISSTALKSRK